MAYTYSQIDVDLGIFSIASTGDKAWWAPGYIPHSVRACSLVVNVASAGTGTVNFTTQLTAYSNAGITAGDIASFQAVATTPMVLGQVVYTDVIADKIIKPGQSIVVNVPIQIAGVSVSAHVYLEQSFENPVNNPAMIGR